MKSVNDVPLSWIKPYDCFKYFFHLRVKFSLLQRRAKIYSSLSFFSQFPLLFLSYFNTLLCLGKILCEIDSRPIFFVALSVICYDTIKIIKVLHLLYFDALRLLLFPFNYISLIKHCVFTLKQIKQKQYYTSIGKLLNSNQE